MTRRKDPKPQQRTETETQVEPFKSLYNGISNGFQEKKYSSEGSDGVILVDSDDESTTTATLDLGKWKQTEIDGIKIVSCVSMNPLKTQTVHYNDVGDDSDDDSSYTSSSFSSLSEESEEEEDEKEGPTIEENERPNIARDFVESYFDEIKSPSRLNVSMGHLLECCDIFEPNFVKFKKTSQLSSVNELCSKFSGNMRLSSDKCRVDLVRLPSCMAKNGALSEMAEDDDTIKWLCASEILTVGNLFSKMKLTWPRPKPRVKSPDPLPPTPVKEASPERGPIKITLRRTSSMAGSDSEPGPYMVTAVEGSKKRPTVKRNFVTKKTTVRRPRQLSLPPPQPAVQTSTASSVDDDSASSSADSSSDTDPDPDHILGCRSYEVENYNLNDILSLTIPFEDPGLFRSPRAASKAAQLKNKQTLAAVRSQTPQNRKAQDSTDSSPNDTGGNIRNILRTMELKSLSEGPEIQEPELPPKDDSLKKKRVVKRRSTKTTDESIDETEGTPEIPAIKKGAKRGPKPKIKPPVEPQFDESSLDSTVTIRDDDPIELDEVKKTKGAKRGLKHKIKPPQETISLDESSQDSNATRTLRRRLHADESLLSSAIPDSGRRVTRHSANAQESETPLITRPTRSNTKVDMKDVPELEDGRKVRKKSNKTEEEEEEKDETVEKSDTTNDATIDDGNSINEGKNKESLRDRIMRAIDVVINTYAPPVEDIEVSSDSDDIDTSEIVPEDITEEDSLVKEIVEELEHSKVVESEENDLLKEESKESSKESLREEETISKDEPPTERDEPVTSREEPLKKDIPSVQTETQVIKVNPDKSIMEKRLEVLRSLSKILEQQNQKIEPVSTVLPKRMLRDPRVRARLQREHEQVDRRTEESPRSPESCEPATTTTPVVVSRIAKISPWPKVDQEPENRVSPIETVPVTDNDEDDQPSLITPPRPPTPPRCSSRPTPTEEAGPSVQDNDGDSIEDGEIRPKKKKKLEEDQELTYKSPLEALESSSKQTGYQRTPVFNKKLVSGLARGLRTSSEENLVHTSKPPESNNPPPEPNHVPHHSDWSPPPPPPAQFPHQPPPPPTPEPENPVFHRRPALLPTPTNNIDSEVFHRRPWNFNRPTSPPYPRSSMSPPQQHFEQRGKPRNHHPPAEYPRPNPHYNQSRPQSIVYEDDPGERYLEELRQMENGFDPYERNYNRPRYDDYERVPTPPPPPRWWTPSPPPQQQQHYRYDMMMRHDRPRSRSRSPPRWNQDGRWKQRRTPSPPPYRGMRRRTPSPYRRPHRY